jgi:hypothetical protein
LGETKVKRFSGFRIYSEHNETISL